MSNKHGYRGLFVVCCSQSEETWAKLLSGTRAELIQIANRLHSRVVVEVFGKDRPHLTAREVECLRWVALGKDATEIAAILKISPHTTRDYLKSVHYKLDCVSSAQAVTKAIGLGLLTLKRRRLAPFYNRPQARSQNARRATLISIHFVNRPATSSG